MASLISILLDCRARVTTSESVTCVCVVGMTGESTTPRLGELRNLINCCRMFPSCRWPLSRTKTYATV